MIIIFLIIIIIEVTQSFDYKANFISSVTNNNLIKNDVKIVIPLKHLSNLSI